MVSTHAWKATVSSPLRSSNNNNNATVAQSQSQQSSSSSSSSSSPFFGRAASNSNSAASGIGGMIFGSPDPKPPSSGGAAGGGPAVTRDFESLLANSASLLSSMGRRATGAGVTGGGGVGNYYYGGGGAPPVPPPPAGTARTTALGEKSLLELDVASYRAASGGGGGGGGGSATTASTYEAEASAHRLFAREGSGFDSATLGRRARELERRANASGGGMGGYRDFGTRTTRMMMDEEEEKKEGFEGTSGHGGGGVGYQTPLADLSGSSLRQILASHHEHCVRTALRRAREQTAESSRRRAEEKIEGDWERERREILGRGALGNRFLAGAGGTTAGRGAAEGGVAARVPLWEGEAESTMASSFGDVVPSPQTMPPGAEGLIRSHLAAVDEHLTATPSSTPSSGADSAASKLASSLQEGIKDATNSGATSESMSGYSNALSLMQSVINCHANLGIDPASANNTSDGRDTAAAAGAVGACDFFATQFASHVREVVRDAELSGMHAASEANDRLGSGTARDVCAFASIAAGRDVVEGPGGVWPRLFYCLRCGDLVAANAVLQNFGNANGGGEDAVSSSISNLVSHLAQLQKSQETIFGAKSLSDSLLRPSQTFMLHRRAASDLYERSRTRPSSPGGRGDRHLPYRTACLAMLGGAESIAEAPALESSGLVGTVEDYLYASLWHAVHLADNGDANAGGPGAAGIGGGSGGGLRRVSEAVARLGALVAGWGPSHFERDDDVDEGASGAVARAARGGGAGRGDGPPPSGGWAFALPLLAARRFATALAYLAEAGGGLGLLQATHLGAAMDVAGMTTEDFSLEGPDEGKMLSERKLLPMLVASYSASLQGLDAGAALKYLVLLSDKGKFVKEQVQRLLLETHQFQTLAGSINPDGSRSPAALDAHFSKKQVSVLLVDAAHHSMRAGKPAEAAELLVLSGKFGALFELMNRELASYLHATTPEEFERRKFWFEAAGQFHAIHLAPGRTYVQTALDAEGSLSLGNTFQLLMNLVVFFDRCREHQWEGALVLMDDLQLLPRTESEMSVKVEAFRALDNCVRRVFHHVVLAAMEALCHLFRTTKQGGAAVGASNDDRNRRDATDRRLDEFRTRARLLVTFARLLNLPSLGDSDTYVRISQLEKNMM